jgi:hypothetical protein
MYPSILAFSIFAALAAKCIAFQLAEFAVSARG